MKEILFFVAVVPNAQIQQEVTTFKEYLAKNFGASHALKSPPHITLFAPFKWASGRVDTLRSALTDFAKNAKHFRIALKNFNVFAPRVLYIDVAPNEELAHLARQLEKYLEEHLYLKSDRRHSFHPHMTIAHKDLKRWLFPQAWAHFSQQSYERSFPVEKITLLKHNGVQWEVFEEFPLAEN